LSAIKGMNNRQTEYEKIHVEVLITLRKKSYS